MVSNWSIFDGQLQSNSEAVSPRQCSFHMLMEQTGRPPGVQAWETLCVEAAERALDVAKIPTC